MKKILLLSCFFACANGMQEVGLSKVILYQQVNRLDRGTTSLALSGAGLVGSYAISQLCCNASPPCLKILIPMVPAFTHIAYSIAKELKEIELDDSAC